MGKKVRRILLPLMAMILAGATVNASAIPSAVVFGLSVVHAAPAEQDGELPRRGYLGTRLVPVPDEVREHAQLESGEGILIEAVFPGTTADTGGIQAGDILLALNGRKIGIIPDLIKAIAGMTVGQKFEVTLLRSGRRVALPLILKERPRDRGKNFGVLYHHVVSGAARIRTIVTRPQTPGKHPVLLLLQGLGPTTIDEPLSGPEPYSRILNEFAESGYVTVRVEKPGIGDSEGGPFADLDFQKELDAYRQALTEVRKYSFVDADKVFIFGHSMGGVFGPIIASEIPIKGIAVYGTVAKTLTEYFLENWRRQATLAADDPARIDAMLRDLAAALHLLLVEQKPPDEVLRVRPDLRSILAKLAPAGLINGRSIRFWSQLVTKNLPAYWTKGHPDVLAMWGRHDFIATEADHPFIAEIVNKIHLGKGTYVSLDDSDHAFRKTASLADSFKRWSAPGGEFNPSIIATLKGWIEKVQLSE